MHTTSTNLPTYAYLLPETMLNTSTLALWKMNFDRIVYCVCKNDNKSDGSAGKIMNCEFKEIMNLVNN